MVVLLIAGGRIVSSVWSGIVTREVGRIQSDEYTGLVRWFGWLIYERSEAHVDLAAVPE